MAPYRDPDRFACPACGGELRAFGRRLCCDPCGGMMVAFDDLAAAIEEHAGWKPNVRIVAQRAGTRPCPRCRAPMQESHFEAEVGRGHAKARPTLDACSHHGVWFDADELAAILEVSRRATEPPSRATAGEIVRTLLEHTKYL